MALALMVWPCFHERVISFGERGLPCIRGKPPEAVWFLIASKFLPEFVDCNVFLILIATATVEES